MGWECDEGVGPDSGLTKASLGAGDIEAVGLSGRDIVCEECESGWVGAGGDPCPGCRVSGQAACWLGGEVSPCERVLDEVLDRARGCPEADVGGVCRVPGGGRVGPEGISEESLVEV